VARGVPGLSLARPCPLIEPQKAACRHIGDDANSGRLRWAFFYDPADRGRGLVGARERKDPSRLLTRRGDFYKTKSK
jgi:hypothetical protein